MKISKVIKVLNDGKPILFLKTVRKDGSSVWAIGKFNRKYEVGQRYVFDLDWPAHVFLPANFVGLNRDSIYNNRKESSGGSRVLICYGVVKEMEVPCFYIYNDWRFSKVNDYLENRLTCNDFVVIGEMTELGKLQTTDSWKPCNNKIIEDQSVVTPTVSTKLPKRDSKGRFVSNKK